MDVTLVVRGNSFPGWAITYFGVDDEFQGDVINVAENTASAVQHGADRVEEGDQPKDVGVSVNGIAVAKMTEDQAKKWSREVGKAMSKYREEEQAKAKN